jgi:hypothetical protein
VWLVSEAVYLVRTLGVEIVMVTTVEREAPRNGYAEFALAFACAFAFLVLVLIQLIVRSRYRVSRLATARRRTRVDANYYLTAPQWRDDRRRDIIDKSVSAFDHEIKNPPQYDREIPTIMAGQCARRDARAMLDKARSAMPPALAHSSMRTIVTHFRESLDAEDALRFLAIFESVLLGVHRADGTEGDITQGELNYMRGYFGGPLAKELRL